MSNLTDEKFEYINERVDKILNVSCNHYDLYSQRSGRPYYPLNNGWALTYLHTGQPFFVNTEDRNITPWIIMGGHWETNVDNVLCEYAKPGMRVIDIGANMGYYTVKLATKIGSSGQLIAFEPNPEVYGMCLENLKINGLTGHARVERLALGNKKGTARLTRSNSNMASANLLGDQDADAVFDVNVEILDDILRSDEKIDLIKLDAEGYDLLFFRGRHVHWKDLHHAP